ncbi:hypothetical protein C9374_009420 [Naegleria lovaniensis]|uniref:Uncharacterized protein n=1 Tax=Naegleria lovaniensis TaxID=51637 RepID=A0AA88KP61_NAELO|nr:uncharacterized protein C9374_009420 [Naegleria lovaniensis]KAG2392843.1 hypothetical protein C9374_009420 [Naegleria lovaniensis]
MEYFALTLFESLNFDQFKDLHGKSLLDCTNESEAIEYIGKKGTATDLMVQILVDDECTTTLRRRKPKIQFAKLKGSPTQIPSSGELKLHALYLGKNKEMTDYHWVTYRPHYEYVTSESNNKKQQELIIDIVKPVPGHPKGFSKGNMWLIIDFQNERGVGVINQQFTFNASKAITNKTKQQRTQQHSTNKRKSLDDGAALENQGESEINQTESSHKKQKHYSITAMASTSSSNEPPQVEEPTHGIQKRSPMEQHPCMWM